MRWRTRIILSVLFGTAATVAVAWACALWSEASEVEHWDEELPADPPSWLPQAWLQKVRGTPLGSRTSIDATRFDGFGVTDEISTARHPELDDVSVLAAETRPTSGWPFRAIQAEQDWNFPAGWSRSGCITPPQWTRPKPRHQLSPRVTEPAALPMIPIPLGFAADTCLYAALGASLSLIPGVVRRHHRRRKGRCPRCNYDRRGLPENAPCPECGQTPSPAKTSDKPAAG